MAEAQEIFDKMVYKDVVSWNALLQGYSRSLDMASARDVFDKMKERDVVSWSSVIRGYVESGENERALEMISQMDLSGFKPDATTILAGLMASGNLMAFGRGKLFHAEIQSWEGDELGVAVFNSLVDFYGKCGSMRLAKQVFDSISGKTLVSWNCLMSAYSQQGNSEQVFHLFEAMTREKFEPDAITFTHLLSACSHAGLTDRGREFFDSMKMKFGMQPDLIHYTCMVDLLCRSNCLDEAVRLVKSMPVRGDAVLWRTIIGACQKSNNVEVGKVAYENLLEIDEKDGAAYVSMANIFSGNLKTVSEPCVELGNTWWTDDLGKVHKFSSF